MIEGFDNTLDKTSELKQKDEYQSKQSFEKFVESFEISKIESGLTTSNNGVLTIDLKKGNISVKDGNIVRFEFGSFEDGKNGVRARDNLGNLILDISGTNNLIT